MKPQSIGFVSGLLLSVFVSSIALASESRWNRSQVVSEEEFRAIDENGTFSCLSENGANWKFTMASNGYDSLFLATDKKEEPYFTGILNSSRRGVSGSLAKYQMQNGDRRGYWDEEQERFGRKPWMSNGLETRYSVEMRVTEGTYILKLSRVFNRDVYWACKAKSK